MPREVGYAAIYCFEKFHHRKIRPVESGNVIVIEWQRGSGGSDLLAIFHQFLYAAYLGERGAMAPIPHAPISSAWRASSALSLRQQLPTWTITLKVFRGSFYPGLGYFFSAHRW